MHILGKVLIVLVLIATGAFVYLAVATWSERQQWTYIYFRHELAIKGLPLEAGPATDDPETVPFRFDYDGAGGIDTLAKKTLEEIFQQARGPQPAAGDPAKADPPVPGPTGQVWVASQAEEVERVRQHVQGRIDAADGPDARLQILRDYLLKLETDPEGREMWIALQPDPQSLETAQAALDGYFTRALTKADQQTSQGQAALSEDGRQHAITHLLYHIGIQTEILNPAQRESVLANNTEWQKRVLTVVGLSAYVDAVLQQARNMTEMGERLDLAIREEAARFRPAYTSLVEHSRELSRQTDSLQQKIAAQEDQLRIHEQIRNRRQTERDRLRDLLVFWTGEAQQQLTAQGDLEQNLFQTQVALGAALDAIVRLEEELQDLELGAK
jgi:hypothetical protein